MQLFALDRFYVFLGGHLARLVVVAWDPAAKYNAF